MENFAADKQVNFYVEMYDSKMNDFFMSNPKPIDWDKLSTIHNINMEYCKTKLVENLKHLEHVVSGKFIEEFDDNIYNKWVKYYNINKTAIEKLEMAKDLKEKCNAYKALKKTQAGLQISENITGNDNSISRVKESLSTAKNIISTFHSVYQFFYDKLNT